MVVRAGLSMGSGWFDERGGLAGTVVRAGLVTDVSGCVVFLASGLSAYVTGTTLHPDGGTFASSGWFNWPDSGWANHAPPGLLPGLPDISLARLIVAI